MSAQNCHRINYFPIEETSAPYYTLRWQPQYICLMFFKYFTDSPIPKEENRNLPQALQPDVVIYFDVFTLAQSKKKSNVSERNANNNDLLPFARATKAKFIDLTEN